MSKKQWKALALSLTVFLISLLILLGITPTGKVLVQRLSDKSLQQCGFNPTNWWVFQASQSLSKKYGVDVCQGGTFSLNEITTRADMASILVQVMDLYQANFVAPLITDLVKKSDLNTLNQLLDQITTQVEALERQ
ncbi:hypothetical protein QQ056_00095 [Oscillatoria laete-virens NRMC-F 0139]|nr:hypothetical protein [Oscillatoria laete-virens]MDL5051979.1 hypothetical protein [Oscillatoria laete-virens NRMC-F 0139]